MQEVLLWLCLFLFRSCRGRLLSQTSVPVVRLERPEATAKELHVALAACGWTDVSFPKVKTVAARVSEEAGAPLPVAQWTNPETAIGATWEPP